MAERTFRSPRVSAREIDVSGPVGSSPQGVPAGVIGTSNRGPAFVPVTVGSFKDFTTKFGTSDGKKFGPMAMAEWLRNASAGTFVRVLGVGNGEKRTTSGDNQGKVTNAGFVVGQRPVIANGNVGDNPYANAPLFGGTGALSGSVAGRTFFLGCFMSQSQGSTCFSEAGGQLAANFNDGRNHPNSHPILRGIIMAPSGVLVSLSSSYAVTKGDTFPRVYTADGMSPTHINNEPAQNAVGSFTRIGAANQDGGYSIGHVNGLNDGKQNVVLLLNGHKAAGEYSNIITASFDPSAENYLAKVLNTDPTKINQAGHLLYTDYPVYSQFAAVTGSGVINNVSGSGGGVYPNHEQIAFMVTSSLGRDAGSTTVPNFENFEDRFRTALSPFVTSQEFGGAARNLFRVHALDDGAYINGRVKISIENIQKSRNDKDLNGSFDLLVRDFMDNDRDPVVLEKFTNLSLNPNSENYVARRIGDQHTFYDFDRNVGVQKLVVDGNYPNLSNYIRVETSDQLEGGEMPDEALPVGFRGHMHLVTSGSGILANPAFHGGNNTTPGVGNGLISGSLGAGDANHILHSTIEPPTPFRDNLTVGAGTNKRLKNQFYWGVQFEVKDSVSEPNRNTKVDPGLQSLAKYLPRFHTSYRNVVVHDNEGVADSGGVVLDADRFNNNRFTLERVAVYTNSSNKPDPQKWVSSSYVRDGKAITDSSRRYLNVAQDFGESSAKPFLKFSFMLQGGFDGVNIFDTDKIALNNAAAKRENDDSSNQGGTKGPTVSAYRRAVDLLEEKTNADIKLLAIPGIRHSVVTDYAMDAVEDRFDALYIMDIEERDNVDTVITGSDATISVSNTVNAFRSRGLDSSFTAAYFPNVVMRDPAVGSLVEVPPSVAVLGAMSLNDTLGHPWFAPAGVTRGALETTTETAVKLNRSNMDDLYDVDVNPLVALADTPGVVVYGQKTLQAAQTALDRVNVRRLLIDIRRQVRLVGNTFLFEPNREETLAAFSNRVNPILQRIQRQQGLDRFKVIIDTTTTTQADVENNTIRGKIFLQPTRTVEFVALDFVVSGGETI